MQLRFTRFFSASVLLGLFLAAIPAQAGGDLPRFPEQSARPASDDSRVAELEELLRQVQELQKAQQVQQAAREKAAHVVGLGVQASPPVVAADREKPEEGGLEKAEGSDPAAKAEQGAEDKEAPSAARPGCMYRGPTLIWEKVPGTCKQ
jgi:hypothetical protein